MLVHDSGVGEIALLVVIPLTGQVIYWECVKRAANSDQVRQHQRGLQGTVAGLLSGEYITKVTEAEPDGFILTTNHGRLIHLTVKDPQGRPLINTIVLKSDSTSHGGFFGSITSVFSSSGWRKDIAAVRVGPMQGKSHCSCIVATAQGVFQVWDLARHSSKNLVIEVDAKDEIFSSIQRSSESCPDELKENLSIVDFAMFPQSHCTSSSNDPYRILVLTFVREGNIGTYHLLDLFIRSGSTDVDVVHPITGFSEAQSEVEHWPVFKAQLLLPQPAHTAFVVFDTAIVLVSLAKIEESPSSQLQIESHTLPDPFQDVLYLRKDDGFHVVGCSTDEAENDTIDPTCVFLVHGFGMARVATLPLKEGESASERSAVTVRSKIEQAIFFGNMKHNLLDFSPERTHFQVKDGEVETAVLDINNSIMRSTSVYIPAITPSMDHQLKTRAAALAELVAYIDISTIQPLKRWELLWSAEKMAAARAIWQWYNTELGTRPSDEISALVALLEWMHTDIQSEPDPEKGETDIVRHYFIHDIWRIEHMIWWASQVVHEECQGYEREPVWIAKLVSQADDIQIHGMEAAFAFRTANAQRYGFAKQDFKDGIYQGDYENLPEVWTSIRRTTEQVRQLAYLCHNTISDLSEAPTDDEERVDLPLLKKLAQDNPKLVHISCQVYEEGSRWLSAKSQTKLEETELYKEYLFHRKRLITNIADLELPDEAIKLAEKYEDMEALVDVLEKGTALCDERLAELGISDDETAELNNQLQSYRERVEGYFTTYGTKWAEALYTTVIDDGNFADVLDSIGKFQPYLTKYLRSHEDLTKVSWINEVVAEKNYAGAAHDLLVSSFCEESLWSRKIELSLAKLSSLAAQENKQQLHELVTLSYYLTGESIEIIEIQEALYRYIRPALTHAIDQSAAEELAFTDFGHHNTVGKPMLQHLMKQHLNAIVAHRALKLPELIETLTLINRGPQHTDEEQFADRRFFFALKVMNHQRCPRHALFEQIIWRRCIIQDDWAAITVTNMRNDEEVRRKIDQTALFKTLKAGFVNGMSRTHRGFSALRTNDSVDLFDKVPPMAPSTLLGAGTTIPSLRAFGYYEEADEGFLKSQAQDYAKEDEVLENILENGRLVKWWDGIIDDVEASIREDADREGILAAERAETKRKLIETMELGDGNVEDGFINGEADFVNGEEDFVNGQEGLVNGEDDIDTGSIDGVQSDGEDDVSMSS